MPGASWFYGATLNYARNALRTAHTEPARTAVIYSERGWQRGHLSYGELDRRGHQAARRACARSGDGPATG